MSDTKPDGNKTIDIKPRSREVTDGLEKAASRGMLRAVGMDDDDFAKPQIGVASSWNEITPCNLSLDRLAKSAKEGVFAAGGYPLEFGTISVSDGISMGHEGMHFSLVSREVIADSVETVMQAERLDGSVLLAGCDKSLPGMLMAAARLDLAAVFLYAGSILPGRAKLSDGTERDVTIIDAFEAVGACARGLMPREDVDVFFKLRAPRDSLRRVRPYPGTKRGLFASPDYLSAFGTPGTPDELPSHTCIGSGVWKLSRGSKLAAPNIVFRVVTSDPLVHLKLATSGLGIANLPLYMAKRPDTRNRLVPVLPLWSPEPITLCALFSGSARLTPKVQVLLDFLGEYIGTNQDPRLQQMPAKGFFTDPTIAATSGP